MPISRKIKDLSGKFVVGDGDRCLYLILPDNQYLFWDGLGYFNKGFGILNNNDLYNCWSLLEDYLNSNYYKSKVNKRFGTI